MQRAGFWSRVAATLLDLAIFLPIYFAAVYLIARYTGRTARQMWDINPVRMSATVGNILWLFYSSTEWLDGRTFGKRILRLRIESIEGGPSARGPLVLRWALKQSPRICGLLDAITVTWAIRMGLAKSGLAFFYHEPMNFKMVRDIGELAALALAGGFLLILLPTRLALHDRLTGTAVYRKIIALAKPGFAPVTQIAPVPVKTIDPAADQPSSIG